MCNNFILSLFSLENKVAIVTGAGGYFGKVFSESLAAAGAKVILLGRGKNVEQLSKSIKEVYGDEKAEHYLVDFYDEVSYRNVLKKAADNNEKIDILVNNAFDFSKETGFNDPSGKMENISKAQWMRSLESGIYWHSLAIQVIGEYMKRQRVGSIINISSMYAVVSPDPELYEGVNVFNPPPYSTVKAAMLALTRYTASFYGKDNVRCNAISPGAFPNVNTDSYNSPKDEGFIKRLEERTVLKRTGVLDDLKGILIFLASDSSGYITGQSMIVDGGWTVR